MNLTFSNIEVLLDSWHCYIMFKMILLIRSIHSNSHAAHIQTAIRFSRERMFCSSRKWCWKQVFSAKKPDVHRINSWSFRIQPTPIYLKSTYFINRIAIKKKRLLYDSLWIQPVVVRHKVCLALAYKNQMNTYFHVNIYSYGLRFQIANPFIYHE